MAYTLDTRNGETQKVAFAAPDVVTYANFGPNSAVILVITSTGSPTITWPATTVWSGGSPPTLTGADVLYFANPDGGSKVYAGLLV